MTNCHILLNSTCKQERYWKPISTNDGPCISNYKENPWRATNCPISKIDRRHLPSFLSIYGEIDTTTEINLNQFSRIFLWIIYYIYFNLIYSFSSFNGHSSSSEISKFNFNPLALCSLLGCLSKSCVDLTKRNYDPNDDDGYSRLDRNND